jgi:hypothetical protein
MQRGNELCVVQKKKKSNNVSQRSSQCLNVRRVENARRLQSETGCAELVQRCQTSNVGAVQPVYNPQCYSTSMEALPRGQNNLTATPNNRLRMLPRGQNNLTATRNNRLFHSAGNDLHGSSSSAPDTWQRCLLRCASVTDAHWPAILSDIT